MRPSRTRSTSIGPRWLPCASVTPSPFAYDGNGNPTTYKGRKCLYDPENHLTDYWKTDPTGSGTPDLSAAYRSDGLLAWKDVAGQRTYFIYDGDKMIGEVTNASKSSVPVLTACNVWGPNGLISRSTYQRSFQYRLLSVRPAGQRGAADEQGWQLLTNERYDAWGNLQAAKKPNNVRPAAANDPLGYKGQFGYYTEHTTGLILCTHRWYDPTTGRWVTRDPAGTPAG